MCADHPGTDSVFTDIIPLRFGDYLNLSWYTWRYLNLASCFLVNSPAMGKALVFEVKTMPFTGGLDLGLIYLANRHHFCSKKSCKTNQETGSEFETPPVIPGSRAVDLKPWAPIHG